MLPWLSNSESDSVPSFLCDRGWQKAINRASDKREAGEEFHSSAHADMLEMRALAYDKSSMRSLHVLEV